MTDLLDKVMTFYDQAASGVTDEQSGLYTGTAAQSPFRTGNTAGINPFSLIFPSDLGSKADADFPYVSFGIIKYRDRWAVQENSGGSAIIGADLTDAITTLGHISLPLPADIQNSVSPQWEMTNTQMISGGAELINRFSNLGDLSMGSGNVNLLNTLEGAWKNTTAILIGDLNKKLRFQTSNPKKQAFFNGIDARNFSFNYTFTPQDEKEAKLLERIVLEFTRNSLPSSDGNDAAFFDFPAEYKISFNNVQGFPVLDYCVCTAVSTNYSASAMQLLKSGHTVSIGLQLTFTETSVRTKESPGVRV